MAKTYRLGPVRRGLNRMMTVLVRSGLGPRDTYLLTVPGRSTGVPRTTPVTLVELAGRRWLVAPYGPVGWVHNVRAAEVVGLRRGRTTSTLSAREVGPAEAAPVLRRYVQEVPIVRPYVAAGADEPVAAFEAVVARHPVFVLDPVPSV